MTISFSYTYLKGLLRLIVLGNRLSSTSSSASSSSASVEALRLQEPVPVVDEAAVEEDEGLASCPVVMAVQRCRRGISPRRTAFDSGRPNQVSDFSQRTKCADKCKFEHTVHEDRFGHVVGIVAGYDVVHIEDVGASVDRLSSEHAAVGA